MGQGTESCTDRPSEVSVIRFVSRNRTIEEIVPKKEVYECKQRGCGKIFTNQDEYKTHEILEALKIRFICREPGCGEEVSDPGSMWRHYQECHNETNVFVCPYTSCSSTYVTSENLAEHIETCHRQPPTLPTEPEIICFVEGSENAHEDDISQCNEEGYFETDIDRHYQNSETLVSGGINYCLSVKNEQSKTERKITTKAQQKEDYSLEAQKLKDKNHLPNHCRIYAKLPKNEDLLITKENFLMKYEARTSKCNDNFQNQVSVVFVNDDVTMTKNMNSTKQISSPSNNQIIDMENLDRILFSGLDCQNMKLEDVAINQGTNCSDDEEYTPKKQRMSRYKKETYRCEVESCDARF